MPLFGSDLVTIQQYTYAVYCFFILWNIPLLAIMLHANGLTWFTKLSQCLIITIMKQTIAPNIGVMAGGKH